MKTRKIVGVILAIVGLFAAICAKDGMDYELGIRFGGIALFAIGALLAKAFDFQNEKQAKKC